MPTFKGPELIIVFAIVLLLFGVGRVGRIGGELGQAVGNFRKGLREGAQEADETNKDEVEVKS